MSAPAEALRDAECSGLPSAICSSTITVMPQRATTRTIVAAVMLLLIAILGGWAGVTLLRKGPRVDDEIVASASAVQVTAIGILLACTLVLVAGITALAGSPRAWPLGLAACAVFVGYGLVANYVLFGSWRPEHTLSNAVVAALVVWLLSRSR